MRRLVVAGVVVLSLVAAGCGSSVSSTPLEEAADEYRQLYAENRTLNKETQVKMDEYMAAGDETLALFDQQRSLLTSGDLAAYRELEDEVEASKAVEAKLLRELEELRREQDAVFSKLDSVGSRVERLKGCDSQCQAAREQAVNLSTQCMTKLAGRVPINQAIETCDQRYPIPRQNILKDVLNGE